MSTLHPAAAATGPAARHLVEAVRERRIADYGTLPEADRRLPAAFLQAVLSGTVSELPDRGAPVRIRGARIEGALRPLPGTTAMGGLAVLQFMDCCFDSAVDFSAAEFLALAFVDCELPALIGANLGTKADLDLSGSRFSGVATHLSELGQIEACAVHLANARVGGDLRLRTTAAHRFHTCGTLRLDGARVAGAVFADGALLDGRGSNSLSARSIVVGGSVELCSNGVQRFEAIGEICLAAAKITGDLIFDSARLHTPEGRALHCEDLEVESVYLSSRTEADPPFECSGRINFLSATVGGSFFFTASRIDPGPDYTGLLARGGPVAINLRQVRVSNALVFNNIGSLAADGPVPARTSTPQPVRGWFLMSGASVTMLADNIASGGPAPGFLEIDGAKYERLLHIGETDAVSAGLRWLRLQFPHGRPDAGSFRPQPYEQLAGVLRSHGQMREADAVAVEKIRVQLEAHVDRGWAWLFPQLLMLISHHGYSTARAVASFLLFVLLGTALYATAVWGFDQPFFPVQDAPQATDYVLVLDLARKHVPQGCPGFDVLHFALDAALPFVDLGQDAHCRFVPQGPARALWLLLNSLYVIIGTALSAVVVLTLTGVMRRE